MSRENVLLLEGALGGHYPTQPLPRRRGTLFHYGFFFDEIAAGTTAAPTIERRTEQMLLPDFIWLGIGINSNTRTLAIRITEQVTGITFMSDWVPLTSLVPFTRRFMFDMVGLFPYRMRGGGQLTVELQNTSSLATRIGVTLIGYLADDKVIPRGQRVPYLIPDTVTVGAGSGRTTGAVPPEEVGDYDYTLTALGLDLESTTAPLFNIYDPEDGELSNPRLICQSLFFADGLSTLEPHYPLAAPPNFRGGTPIRWDLESTDGDNSQTLNTVFIGYQDRRGRI